MDCARHPYDAQGKESVTFIGDGMTTNMITAARLIAHKSIDGKYQTRMAMNQISVLGHQMTQSLDSYITDRADSATALYTGHKTTANALGVYADSSPSPSDDPKIESTAEIFHRIYDGAIGIVSTAFIADATLAALTVHTRNRGTYSQVVDSEKIFHGLDCYNVFKNAGYQIIINKTALQAASNSSRSLGIFSVKIMAKWLDRNVYKNNLNIPNTAPEGSNTAATDQPGVKETTLKPLQILHNRYASEGFFLMSEAVSNDKQMHVLDHDRALGELLELGDTIKAIIAYLEQFGQLNETFVVSTADDGHGFDVMGSVDTHYLNVPKTDFAKRGAVGLHEQSGLSQYTVPIGQTNPAP